MKTRFFLLLAVVTVSFLFSTSAAAQDQGVLYRVSIDAGSNDFSRYDIASDSWETLTPFATQSQMATSVDGRLFAWNVTAGEIQEYDPGTDTWSFIQAAPPVSPFRGNLEYRANGEWVYTQRNNSNLYYTSGGVWQSMALPFPPNATGDYDAVTDALILGQYASSHNHAINLGTMAVTSFTLDNSAISETRRCGQVRNGLFYYQNGSNSLRSVNLNDNTAAPVDVVSNTDYYPSCAASEVSNDLYINALNGSSLNRFSLDDNLMYPLAGHTTFSNHSSIVWVGESGVVGEGPVQFATSASFAGGNAPDVLPDVTITCNSGLPLSQTAQVGVTFTVTEILPGAKCTIELAEDFDSGWVSGGALSNGSPSGESCVFTAGPGQANNCVFSVVPAPFSFSIGFEWNISKDADPGVGDAAMIHAFCENIWDGSGLITTTTNVSASPDSIPNPFVWTGLVPDPNDSTQCYAYMEGQGSVVDADGCDTFSVKVGDGDQSCTIYATAFFEGIPTLSQYGMVVMALLMLGVGFVGFRRFI
jgi:hypothetical protein